MTNAQDHAAWLAQTQEEIIAPELPLCDPHHHLWADNQHHPPYGPYLLDQLLADTGSGHNVVRTVFIDCGANYRTTGPESLRPVGETEFVEAAANESEARRRHTGQGAVIAGIVSFADLTLGDAVTPVLEAHLAASPSRFRGIRHIVSWDAAGAQARRNAPPPGLLLDPTFRRGFACLQPLGLHYEAWLYHPQLPDLLDLARSFPETTIVLNHIGGVLGTGPYADLREAVFAYWRHYIAALAACPNVVVKLGGLGMPLSGLGWNERAVPAGSAELAEGMRPYYGWCIEQFGPDRCMFESNFPVDKISYGYPVMWNAFKRIAQDYSATESAALLHDTAVRVYRLDPAA